MNNFSLKNKVDYQTAYEASVKNPEQFWGDLARTNFQWKKPWSKVLDYDFSTPKISWFEGAQLNITENCIDRHLETNPDKTAIIFEPNDSTSNAEHISYKELHCRVNKFANVLKSKGIRAAKANGVPTNKVKISLFMFTAFCATMFAACQVFEVNTADTAKGNLKELEAIAAAVIGGVVLTGGFGTILGIILGTIIFGIAKEAFFYIPGIDGSFYRVFLGAVLVAAALTNENIRKRIIGSI